MASGFLKATEFLIYKGKVFIGSFGCRNDCLAVHFNCQKRHNSGVPPPEHDSIVARFLSLYVRFWLYYTHNSVTRESVAYDLVI